ncbi:DUF423 domain-containing protein [Cohnella sp. CFH 77786]|uniref:DUF423 domain-containing protein n=1 Tax=Cohnella sp. CFH 77786 TaxID=2662265 RepID=UPI001C60A977|nr:DUF423 domain-containing protein [Cohnella sp. CFH 77786]MBW5447752.1 DUF423 domain-containing protein [Cohnella sp. CFH 77786]
MSAFVRIGAIAAMLSVAIGAFGAHALEGRISEHALEVYHKGVQYHMFHALGILLIAALADKLGSPKLALRAAGLLLAGIVLFSGSLYALALSGVNALGAITPLGGVAFLAGWLCLALAARKPKG